MTAKLPSAVSQALADLSVVANLPRHHKLNVARQSYVYVGTWQNDLLARVSRGISGETGEITCDHLDSCIDRAVSVAREYPGFDDEIEALLLDCRQAITYLIDVYKDNISVQGRLRAIAVRLVERRVRETFADLREPPPDQAVDGKF